jgi:hypothetical protein
MSDATLPPEAVDSPWWRSGSLIAGLGFVAGVAVTGAALGLAGGLTPRTAAVAPANAPAQQRLQPAPMPGGLPPAGDIATLDAREAALAGRLDQIETRLRDADASSRNASGYATRAERMLVAIAARRAIERAQPLGPVETQLRLRFGESNPDAVAAIIAASRAPMTLDDLRLALDNLAPQLLRNPDDALWDRARRILSDLVVLRPADVPSPRPADRLRRARRALDEGNIETALAEVARMPGVASADNWVAAARRQSEARRALTEIERAAIQTPLAPAPAAGSR